MQVNYCDKNIEWNTCTCMALGSGPKTWKMSNHGISCVDLAILPCYKSGTLYVRVYKILDTDGIIVANYNKIKADIK